MFPVGNTFQLVSVAAHISLSANQHQGDFLINVLSNLFQRQCSPMAVGPSDISGNDWCGPVNSSPAADRMSDKNFGANPVFLGRNLS